MNQATQAARLTPPLPSAIATIAVRGPRAVEIVMRLVRLKPSTLEIGRIHFGAIPLADRDPAAQEQVVVCRTQDRAVELHCHGGAAICQAVLNGLQAAGCQVVDAHALAEPERSAVQAAAEEDLLKATTDSAAAILLDQSQGALERGVQQLISGLQQGRTDEVARLLDRMLAMGRHGVHLAEPWRIVMAGPPNVGKSSLINAIVGQPSSIVHHLPGTTRDWVESHAAIGGWPVSLTDTAGIRDASDQIESAGVNKTLERLRYADVVVVVIDATVGWTNVHGELYHAACQRLVDSSDDHPVSLLACLNKCDLIRDQRCDGPMELVTEIANRLSEIHDESPRTPAGKQVPLVICNAIQPEGFRPLLARLETLLTPERPGLGEAVPFRTRHVVQLRAANSALHAGNRQAAMTQLVELHDWLRG